jgi:hypothetical protein
MKKQHQDALRKQSKIRTKSRPPIKRKVKPAATETGQKAKKPATGKETKE